MKWIGRFRRALAAAVRGSSDIVYLTALALFLTSKYIERIVFSPRVPVTGSTLQLYIMAGFIWIIVVHIPVVLVKALPLPDRKWIRIPVTIAGVFALGTLATLKGDYLSIDQTYLLASIYLILFACGRDFRKILYIYLTVYSGLAAFAMLGIPLGYTMDNTKHSTYGVKYSFGMIHPNTTAHMLFMILLLLWILFGPALIQKLRIQSSKSRFLLMAAFFWVPAIPLTIFIRCRTITVLMFLFPLVEPLTRKAGKWFRYLPVFCTGITFALCFWMEPLHHYTYGGFLQNFSERFVQGGIALRHYGLPLFGKYMVLNSANAVLNGKKINLYVMDNAYVSYGIIYGLVWLVCCLLWLGFANTRLWREQACTLLAVSAVMLLFAIMERRGLDAAYNFILLYPLASAKNLLPEIFLYGQELKHGD